MRIWTKQTVLIACYASTLREAIDVTVRLATGPATVENVIFACKDINECLTGSHGCQGNCSNTEGSYLCTCTEGLLLQNDRFSCKSKMFNMHFVLCN